MKAFVSILLTCSVMSSYAQKRDTSELKNIARSHFFSAREGTFHEEKLTEEVLNFGHLYRYVDSAQPTRNGFVIISENRNTPKILAFGDQVDFPADTLPEHIRQWLNGYAQMADTVEASETVEEWLDVSHLYVEAVNPLLGSINWGQDDPYNLDCPQINGEYAPTGCVATAVAQIMKYFQWPEKSNGKVEYTTYTNKIPISCSLETTIDWEHIYDVYAPAEAGTNIQETVANNNTASVKNLYISPLYSSARACVVVENLVSVGTSSFCGEYALLLFDENNNFIQRVSEKESVEMSSSAQITSFNYIYPSISSSLSDGDYIIRCGIRRNSSDTWSTAVISTISSANNDSIHIRKIGSSIYTNGNRYPCSLTREEISPVSILLRNLGASLTMDYALAGSGTSSTNVPVALNKYFNYDTDMFMANPDCFTDEQWHQLLQEELAVGRPVYYSGYGSQGGGHAFVIDGVMEKDGYAYYHVNWGWDGLCNGYYLLNMLRPSTAGTGGEQGANYSNQAQMVVGIQPEDSISNVLLSCKEYKTYETSLLPGEATSTSFAGLTVCSSQEEPGILSVRLKNQQTNDTVSVYEEQRTVKSGNAGSTQYIRVRIPQDALPGTYDVYLNFETQDGRVLEFRTLDWPSVEVRNLSGWIGGELTTARQSLAVSSVKYDWSTAEVGRISVVCDSILNIFPKAASGYLSLLVCNTDGKLLSNLSESTALLVRGDAISRNTRINGTVSQNIPDGEYLLKIGFMESGADRWTYVRKLEYTDNLGWARFKDFSIPFTMRNGVFCLDKIEMMGKDIPWTETGIDSTSKNRNEGSSVYSLGGSLLLEKGKDKDLHSLPGGTYIIGKKKVYIHK